MMRAFRLLLVLVGILCLVGGVEAEEANEDCLTVFGEATVLAKADRATISFQIKSEAKSLRSAFERAHEKIKAIVIQLKEIGLDESNLSTSLFESTENKGNKAFLSSKRDFKVTQTALVTIDRLDLLEEVVFILSESQVESVSDISFDLIDSDELRLQAVKKAVKKAKLKAEVMVAELGVKLGPVVQISEYFDQQVYIRGGRARAISYIIDGAPSMFASDISIDVNVKLRFEIDNGKAKAFESK